MPALSCARVTSLFAILLSQCCPNALPLQEQEECSSCTDTSLNLLQKRARQPASAKHAGKDIPALEAGPFDIEEALTAVNFKASIREDVEKPGVIKMHVHFHKAGGTWMCNLAKAAGEVTPKPDLLNCNWKPDDVHVEVNINKTGHPSCDERRQYYAKNGITYAQLEREVHADDLCEGIQYSCLFRDPISLIQSLINFEQTVEGILSFSKSPKS